MPHPLVTRWASQRLVAVIRAQSYAEAHARIQQVQSWGITELEITLTFPRALDLVGPFGAGCGSVMSLTQAQDALSAGAKFIVSPFTHPEIIALARDQGVMVVSGAWTATEIYTAHQLGADVIKLFPAVVGGPSYLKTLNQLFPDILFFPCGGVTRQNACAFLEAGALAVGVGQGLDAQVLDQVSLA